ncbi:MAG: EI24 domain-containing protein [Polyangiaceae bacterium]
MGARKTLDDFAAGLAAPWRGVSFLATRPATWRLAAVPALVACLLVLALGWGLIHLALGAVAAFVTGGGALHTAARLLLDVIASLVAAAVAVYLALTLASPLSAKALDGLVRAHDEADGAPPYPRIAWATSASRALAPALIGLAVGVPVTLLVALVDFVFPAAVVLMLPLGTLVSGYVIAWNLLDYPLGLRAVRLVDRARWMGQRMALVTGFALSSSLLLLVPGLGLLLLPAGVVGAAIIVERGGVATDRVNGGLLRGARAAATERRLFSPE